MAKRHPSRRPAAPRAVRVSLVRPQPIRGGSQALSLAEWADAFEDTARRLKDAAERLERIGEFCRLCNRVMQEGLDALPLLVQRLGMQLLGSDGAGGALALLSGLEEALDAGGGRGERTDHRDLARAG